MKSEYLGTILEKKDLSGSGRYYVHIPELQASLSKNTGILVKNQISDYRVTPSKNGIYGSYYPLQPGTLVKVKFKNKDLQTGYIDSIVSDHQNYSLPLKSMDRDDFYQILRTPKYNNLIAICEDTGDKPKNSIHICYNGIGSSSKSYIVIDSTGIHINSQNNINIKITGNANLEVTGKINIKSTSDLNIQSSSKINMKAPIINIDSPQYNLNTGAATDADTTTPPTLITDQEYKYFKNTDGNNV